MKLFDISLGVFGSRALGTLGAGALLLGLAALLATNPVGGEPGLLPIIALVLGILGAWFVCAAPFVHSGRSRISSPPQRLCTSCRYDLRASDTRCPECGAQFGRNLSDAT